MPGCKECSNKSSLCAAAGSCGTAHLHRVRVWILLMADGCVQLFTKHGNEVARSAQDGTAYIENWLEAEAVEGHLDRLILIASPEKIRTLRASLGHRMQSMVVAELERDFSGTDEDTLRDELKKILWF